MNAEQLNDLMIAVSLLAALLLVGAVTATTPSRGPVAVAQQGQSRLVVFETFLTPG